MVKTSNNYIVAIIPARGGSKRLPRKNIYPFRGKPMISWSIEAAQRSKLINEVFVSSEDNEILKIALQYGSEIIKRPNELADDKIFKMEVIKHAVKEIEKNKKPNVVISLQANSPEITASILDESIHKLYHNNLNEVISLDENLVQNGAIRVMKYSTVFQEALSVYMGAIQTNIKDIHTLEDLEKIL